MLFQLVDAYKKASQPDILALSECWVYLNDPASMAQVFKSFTNTSEEKGSQLMAFQAAFHLISIAPQDFIQRVLQTLGNEANNSDSFDAKLVRVLKGDKSRELTLQFLCRNNHIDRYILQQTKSNINAKSSLHHSALTLSHGILQCGTSNDDFLRSNMEFLSYASNWSKFSATASLGLVHMGQVNDGMSLLSAYLPKENQLVGNHGGYAEGGSLLALGLIHGNHGDLHVLKYLLGQLQGHSNAVIQHGAALGIGVSGLASQHTFLIEPLKATLFGDEAVAGEAAALAIGMVMLGTRNAALISELLQYAHDTQHEKIVRGISISIALMLYGCEDEADAIIAQLLHDKDPMLRYGGIYGIALAYAGTSNKGMLEKVLHVAVSDTSDDVRRAAVISIGFLCFKAPEQVPKLVKLLVESYNPHVRFGAAIALGISCCGGIVQAGASANGRNGTSAAHSGYASQALSLLEPLMADMVDFVRQGALIATSMVLIQATEALEPRVTQVRSLYQKIISDKREDVMTKFGAILSQGLIDAGGHNVTLQLSVEGHRRMEGIVGLALFSQFWYWYPMSTFLGLALVPTHITLLDETLKAPKMAINIAGGNKNGTISSLFAYPESTKPQDKKEQAPLVVATLSTTTKAKARLSKKSSSEKLSEKSTEKSGVIETKMEIDPPVLPSANFVNNSSSGKTSLENGSRVLPLQSTLIKFKWEGRFQPILPQLTNGFIMVQDKTYEVPVVYLEESVIEKEPAPLIEEAAVDADAMMEE